MTLIKRAILALALIAGLNPAFAQVPPPVPALPDTERRTSYSLTGSTCTCSVGFQLYGDSTDFANWLTVWVNGVQQVGGWTITSPTGPLATIPRPIVDGVLTFNTAQTGTVQIVGARRPRRASQFPENRGVAARDFNVALTDLVAQNREVWDKTNDLTGRVLRGIPGETFATFPLPAVRASTTLGFDANGNLAYLPLGPTISVTAGSTFNTRGLAQAASISATVQFVQTAGYTAAGDGGGALYSKAGGTTPCGFQSADGQWWTPDFSRGTNVGVCGAVCDNGVADNTVALQAAINAAGNVPSGYVGVLQLGPCRYKHTAGLTDSHGIFFVGIPRATWLDCEPTADIVCLEVRNGSNTIMGGIRDVGYISNDQTHTKTAVRIVDTQFRYELTGFWCSGLNVNGSNLFSGGAGGPNWTGSTCLQLMGRDSYHGKDVVLAADLPLHISQDPNLVFGDLDLSDFSGTEMIANGNPCILIDPPVVLGRIYGKGNMWCGLGTFGIYYNGISAITSISSPALAGATAIASNNVNWIVANKGLGITLASGVIQNVAVTSVVGLTVNFTPALTGNVNSNAIIYPGGLLSSNNFTLDSFHSEQGDGPAAFTASITSGLMTVTSVSSGTIKKGHVVTAPGVTNGNVILSFGTGTGGVGTYNLMFGSTVGSEAMTAQYTNIYFAPMGPVRNFVLNGGGLDPARSCLFLRNLAGARINSTTCFGTSEFINADSTVADLGWDSVLSGAPNTFSGQTFLRFDPPQLSTSLVPTSARLTNITTTAPAPGSTLQTWLDTQACTPGQVTLDANFIYACTATNTVKRAPLTAF